MASKPNVGYLGLGIMGTAMAKNLLKSGLFGSVVVWNRSNAKCEELVKEGAKMAGSPKEVIEQCDMVFACLADPSAAQEVVFGANGVLEGLTTSKAYIDMSTVDEGCSKKIGEAVKGKGARFLEAPVSGSKQPAIAGQLIILCAGDQSLFQEALPALNVMGKKSFFLGEVGAGARMKLCVNMVMGCMMGTLCEGMGLAEKSNLSQHDLLEVLGLGAMACPLFAQKGPGIEAHNYPTAFPLKHQQKDLRLALDLGASMGQLLNIAAATNEAYKAALADHGDKDFSAVMEAISKKK